MDTYNQSVCHNCLVQGCRGHNCDENDREIHEAIPDVMAVLHEDPALQQGLLDALQQVLQQGSPNVQYVFLARWRRPHRSR